MKTIDMSWVDCANEWFNTVTYKVNSLYEALSEANAAISTVSSAGDIGSLGITLTNNDLETLHEKRQRLMSFCNAVHYEISQMIDNPFSVSLADTLQQAYDLNPSNFKVKTGTTLWWDNMTSLGDLIKSTMTDKKLKESFEKRINGLDRDAPSNTLKDAIKEAKFWQGEFKHSDECQKIAGEVFTKDVRNRWATMTVDERKQIVQNYENRISQEMFKADTTIGYNTTGYGLATYGVLGMGRRIDLNPEFVNNPTKDYSIDNMIDTLTHETRHQYQDRARGFLSNYGISDSLKDQWNAPYISYEPSKNNYNDYYNQEVERDARAFAGLSNPG